MIIRQKLEKLATERNTPCVTISLNTNRTHPGNEKDLVQLTKFIKEAKKRVLKEFGKRPVVSLLKRLSEIENELDVDYNLASIHIYLSNDTKEIIRSAWPIKEPGVYISNKFNILSLTKSYKRSVEYFILLLSPGGAHLYNAINDVIVNEITNDEFPFLETSNLNTYSDNRSDSEHNDDLVYELSNLDKAVVKMNSETGLNCFVVCTVDNYSHLMQVAENPSIYIGFSNINKDNTTKHHIACQSWELVKGLQYNRRAIAIRETKEAVAQGTVLTDLEKIYLASIEGRGELLIVHQEFSQPVVMTSDRTFELTNDRTEENAIDDITNKIAWTVLSKKGRVFFTAQEEIKELGNIVLKTRY